MTRTQIQFPWPLYQRLKEIAERQDVTHFATSNVKHFEGFGFERFWSPN